MAIMVLEPGVEQRLLAERRLSQITGALGRLAAGDLSARTGITRRSDDLDALAHRVDATAGELERLVTQTRHLSASLAHDLRTPLARLHARLETLPEGAARDAAVAEAAHLSQIFDAIMRIARIEATQGAEGLVPVDLADIAADIEDTFGPVVEDAGKSLALALSHPAEVSADRQMLIQALANLIQNALVHGGREITLFVRGAEIGVADTGDGVDPSQFDEITKPMVRLDAARQSAGSGLGLALVRAVADRHAAALRLSQNQPRGLSVALKFADL
jgi:signal transduction histidine kinase